VVFKEYVLYVLCFVRFVRDLAQSMVFVTTWNDHEQFRVNVD